MNETLLCKLLTDIIEAFEKLDDNNVANLYLETREMNEKLDKLKEQINEK